VQQQHFINYDPSAEPKEGLRPSETCEITGFPGADERNSAKTKRVSQDRKTT
jgi:hypothetical protein